MHLACSRIAALMRACRNAGSTGTALGKRGRFMGFTKVARDPTTTDAVMLYARALCFFLTI